MNPILVKAGQYQMMSLIVFCAAACVGVFALILGNYFLAGANGLLMAANFYLYQKQSAIIRQNLSRP